jgi:hypothetical protein
MLAKYDGHSNRCYYQQDGQDERKTSSYSHVSAAVCSTSWTTEDSVMIAFAGSAAMLFANGFSEAGRTKEINVDQVQMTNRMSLTSSSLCRRAVASVLIW